MACTCPGHADGPRALTAAAYALRKVLHAGRRAGSCLHRGAAVGRVEEVQAPLRQVRREPQAGMSVVATCVPDYEDGAVLGLPLLGVARDLAARLQEVEADTVAGTAALSSRELREPAWDLEGACVDLAVAPAITDVAGPRIHVRPVAGLPLLQVEEPTFAGVRKAVKNAIDVTAALLLVVVLALPGLVVAMMVGREDGGPVLYQQRRVGRNRRPFRIYKFRTIRIGADQELAGLMSSNEHDGRLFRMRDDP